MFFQSPILSEISEYIEKLPKERQLKLLNDLKRETTKSKKPTAKNILELSAEVNKKSFKKVKSRYV